MSNDYINQVLLEISINGYSAAIRNDLYKKYLDLGLSNGLITNDDILKAHKEFLSKNKINDGLEQLLD